MYVNYQALSFQASLETFFGLGLIVGPTLGGALYSIGGYTTPFAVLGSTLFLAAVMTALVLPKQTSETDITDDGRMCYIQNLFFSNKDPVTV